MSYTPIGQKKKNPLDSDASGFDTSMEGKMILDHPS
jgi:hypothetical protein